MGPESPAASAAVASGNPLATDAALVVLRAGGTAADAAIAADAVMGVVEPTSTGVGGDVMAVVAHRAGADGGWRVEALNGIGRYGRKPIPLGDVRSSGTGYVVSVGGHAVTAPGAVAAWGDLHQRFGGLPWPEVLAPASEAAWRGVRIGPVARKLWASARGRLDPAGEALYFPFGEPPGPATIWTNPALAATLGQIAAHGPDAFYTGELAAAIATAATAAGSTIDIEDLASHKGEWVTPLRVPLGRHELVTLPPPCQGVVLGLAAEHLQRAGLLSSAADTAASSPGPADLGEVRPGNKGRDNDGPPREGRFDSAGEVAAGDGVSPAVAGDHSLPIPDQEHDAISSSHQGHREESPATAEGWVEMASTLDKAFAVALETVADPAQVAVPGFAEMRSRLAGAPTLGPVPYGPGTVFTAVATPNQMVALISSVCDRFGAGVTVGKGGFVLQSRARGFTLDPGHPNAAGPSKRPYHTIVPTIVLHGQQPMLSLGVVGGIMQPQGQLQILRRLLSGSSLAAAVKAPRFRLLGDGVIATEPSFDRQTLEGLAAAGYRIVGPDRVDFGSAGAVMRTRRSAPGEPVKMEAEADHRRDGSAATL